VELFNASGAARRLQASPLFAVGPSEPGPALRRGALVAVPVGLALLFELGLDSPSKGAIGTGALLAGFPGLDAPARIRAGWQAATAPLIGLAAALGVLTGSNAVLAIVAMAALGAAAGYCFAVSLRLSIAGLSVALSLLITQGLPLEVADAVPALLLATAGGLLQAAFSVCVWIAGDRTEEGGEKTWSAGAAAVALRANLTLGSVSFRHALRFGAALATAFAYGLLTVQYALFTAAITTYAVLLADSIGEAALRAAGQRALATAIGIAIAGAAFVFWPNPKGGRRAKAGRFPGQAAKPRHAGDHRSRL
jgi:hypothetical protein